MLNSYAHKFSLRSVSEFIIIRSVNDKREFLFSFHFISLTSYWHIEINFECRLQCDFCVQYKRKWCVLQCFLIISVLRFFRVEWIHVLRLINTPLCTYLNKKKINQCLLSLSSRSRFLITQFIIYLWWSALWAHRLKINWP